MRTTGRKRRRRLLLLSFENVDPRRSFMCARVHVCIACLSLCVVLAMCICSAFRLNASERDLVELTPMLLRARKKFGLDLPLFRIDHTSLAMDFREVSQWEMPKTLVNQRVILLVRDPRDVMVSNWFEKKYRKVSRRVYVFVRARLTSRIHN